LGKVFSRLRINKKMPNPTQTKVNIQGDIITFFQREGIWYADFGRVGGTVIRMGE